MVLIMSSKITCRCCLTWSADKDLKARNRWLGETEVYADMIKECFDIHINIGLKPTERGICYSCILHLRDALSFKRQVHKCVKEFENRLQNGTNVNDETEANSQFQPIDVKQENIIDMHEIKEANNSEQQNDTDEASFGLIEEFGEQEDAEDDEKSLASLAIDELTKRIATTNRVAIQKLSKPKPMERGYKISAVKKPVMVSFQGNCVRESPRRYPASKLKDNLLNIMEHSNVTPFLGVNYNGIECALCKKTEKDLERLKLHNTTHDNFKCDILIKTEVARQSIKLDITDLKCNKCDYSFDVVSNLKKHLIDIHEVKFYDVTDYYLEFKLPSDGKFDCALCSSSFDTFKMLLQHTSGHYRNYTCDECDCGFQNQYRLKKHNETHSKTEFKCSHCDKVFKSKERKKDHEKEVHSATKTRFTTKCPLCSELFTRYYNRNRHMVKVHKTSANYKCNVCDRSFLVSDHLTKHIKRDHLMEKNHSCEECSMQFYSKPLLKAHMIKHSGEKKYKCNVCTKAYARRSTLKEHMKIHMNDRRFKCGVCGLTFVQKSSLKGHMISKHDIALSEYERTAQSENSSTVISK